MTVRGLALRSFRAVAVLVMVGSAPLFAAEDAAHAVASKFSQAGNAAADADRKALQKRIEDEERFRADEAEMLERAKAEDAERKASEAARDAQRATERDKAAAAERERQAAERNQAKAAREKEAAAAREKAAAARAIEATRVAEEQRKLEEERLARAKAESERLAAEQRAAEERAAADKAKADAERQHAMESAREEEGRRLSEKLRRAREERELKSLDREYSALGNPPPAREQPETQPPPSPAAVEAVKAAPAVATAEQDHDPDTDEADATILLVMEPGARGIRRFEPTADPVLCLGPTCYISNGPQRAATPMTRGRAFGPGNTLGQRAGACRHSLGCVFRGVPVGRGEVALQPVDLRFLRHDRREVQMVHLDKTCAAGDGRLRCGHGVHSRTYRVWIVPERVARRAGDAALLDALGDGLPDSRSAELSDD